MDTSVLEDVGLSKIEIKVFLSILEFGETKAGKIIEKTKLQSSSVYNAINAMIDRGLISYIKKGQVKFYRAADPETILNYLDSKKEEFLKLLPELKARQIKKQEEGVEFYKSYRGIKTIMFEILKDSKKGNIYRTFSIEDPEQYEKARERVYRTIKQIAIKKKIIMRGIFHQKNRYKTKKSSIMRKKYVNFSLPPNTIILNNKVAIISWEEEPIGILIYSKDIAKRYEDFFDKIWEIAK